MSGHYMSGHSGLTIISGPTFRRDDMKKLAAVLSLTALAVGVGSSAMAQQQRLVVAGYGGSFEEMMRKDIFPAFEKKHNVKIDYVAGNSTNTVARLQAQKGNQEIDVAIVDDGPMYQAIALGFCAPIKGISDDIHQNARFKDDKAVGLGLVATGLMYNKKYFADKGWPAPTSWNDLADPKFKKLVVIPPLNNTYGLHSVIQFARAGGGGEKNMDPGFKAFKEKIGPNVLVYEPSPGKMTELFSSNQAVLGVWGTGRVKALADTSFPVGFVYPKEGAFALMVAGCPIAKPNATPLANEFVQYLLTPEVQSLMGTVNGYGPVNKKASIKDDPNVPMPIGKRAADLIVVDWDVINNNRDAWNKRWTREIER